MKRIIRNITAAESTEDTRFDDLLSAVKADFDYLPTALNVLQELALAISYAHLKYLKR